MPPLKNGFVFTSPIRRKRDYGTGAMALTEYKVDRVRSRAASCNGLDRWIYDDIFEGIDTVATLLICLDYPHIRVSGAARRTKVSEERTRVPQTRVYGYFCFLLSVAKSRPAVGAAGGDAICPNCRWIRWLCRWGLPARGSFASLLTRDDAHLSVGRNGGAAGENWGRPCGVTANFSRLVECSVVVREAAASARTSR